MKIKEYFGIEFTNLTGKPIPLYFCLDTKNRVYSMSPRKIKPLSTTEREKQSSWATDDSFETAMTNLAGDKKNKTLEWLLK